MRHGRIHRHLTSTSTKAAWRCSSSTSTTSKTRLGVVESDKRICAFQACRRSPAPFQRTFQRHNAAAPLGKCPLSHTMPKCKCHLPIFRLENNVAIIRAYALAKGVWICNGVQVIRNKTEPGEVVSAVQDEHRGFGFALNAEEPARANEYAVAMAGHL